MTWTWRLETAGGEEMPGDGIPVGGFPTQADAESWLGEEWRRLRTQGVDQVRLFDVDREVYGPMSLHDAG